MFAKLLSISNSFSSVDNSTTCSFTKRVLSTVLR
jgi:hypothetical protein